MIIVLVLILIALLAVVAMKDKIPAYKAVVPVLFVVGIAAAFVQFRPEKQTFDESEDVSLGRVLGEIMAAEVAPGSQVLIIDSAFQPGKDRYADARLEGLGIGWKDAGLQPVRIDPALVVPRNLDPSMKFEAIRMVGTGYTDAASWFEVLKQHPEAAAIVSFVGLPNDISRKDLEKLPPTYLGRRGQVPIASEELIKLENVRAIVDFRMPNTPPQDGAEELPEIFTRKYYLLQG